MKNIVHIPEKKELAAIHDSFISEIKLAADNKKSSLSYLTHTLPHHQLIADTIPFQVISIGGTVCKSALARKNGKTITLDAIQTTTLPIFDTADRFYSFIISLLSNDISFLALNFAYPLQACIRENKIDGTLIRGSKEHTFIGLIGKTVGREIEQYIYKTLGRHIEVTLANDTACLVLSGLTIGKWNETAGCVIGTGTNLGFFADEHMFVNLESANFDKFTLSENAQAVDLLSASPGTALFEKEVSGAYTYQSFNYLVRTYYSSLSPINSGIELFTIAETPNHPAARIAQQIFKRSAYLLAAQIAGLYHYRGYNVLTLVIEGSVFWKNGLYRNELMQALRLLDVDQEAIQFRKVENSELLGPSYLIGA